LAGTLALNTAVLRPGLVRVGDQVRLLTRQEAGDLISTSPDGPARTTGQPASMPSS
jgi:hypothetical protein